HRAGCRAAAVAAGGRLSRTRHRPLGRASEMARSRGPIGAPVATRTRMSKCRTVLRRRSRTRQPRPRRPCVTSATYQGVPMSVANTINWFELYVQDMRRARAFYEGVLGIALEPLKLPEGGDEGLEMWSFPGD